MPVQSCHDSTNDSTPTARLPSWVPDAARLYLSHTAKGIPLRVLARHQGCAASTVMRQVRRFENRRDDPLVDRALARLDRQMMQKTHQAHGTEKAHMQHLRRPHDTHDAVTEEGCWQILRLLAQPDCRLIVAPDLPKAVVSRDSKTDVPERLAVCDRQVAEVLALKDWISRQSQGRVASYTISQAGRSALRAWMAQTDGAENVLEDQPDPERRRVRYGNSETPVCILARRRDKDGRPFLVTPWVQAAERIREDFIAAQLDEIAFENAESLVLALESKKVPGPNIAPTGTKSARKRVLAAFQDLGAGLGDIVLRSCCQLEGVESAERSLGWSARSGKIVLRIALQRLSKHYREMGDASMMIG